MKCIQPLQNDFESFQFIWFVYGDILIRVCQTLNPRIRIQNSLLGGFPPFWPGGKTPEPEPPNPESQTLNYYLQGGFPVFRPGDTPRGDTIPRRPPFRACRVGTPGRVRL